MNQLVFFWIGENLSIPEFFVKSIKKIESKKFKIIQVSNLKTRKIKGVDKIIKTDLPKDIMTARLKAYSLVDTKDTRTIFCDADSLMVCNFDLSDFERGYYLMKRKNNSLINHFFPEYYPEFKNKYFMDVMPFLFGAIIIIKKENFFNHLFNICINLHPRFHRWYGDQIALHVFYLDNKSLFLFFDQSKYMHIIDKKDNNPKKSIKTLRELNIPLLTFKGNKSKERIRDFFQFL